MTLSNRLSVGKDVYALKKMVVATEEHLDGAEKEIAVLQRVKHPHVIPLLESSIVQGFSVDEGMNSVYMLFPWFKEGTAVDVVSTLHESNNRLSPWNVLDIFRQVCDAVGAVHDCGFAHRDIKPHNILLEQRTLNDSAALTLSEEDSPSIAMLSPIPEGSHEEFEGDDPQADVMYNAVLTDFGSAGPLTVTISSRQEALRLQEEAQAQCTMPYRAPELYDVPSSCIVDERIDVWSLGCLLYFLMYGISPFEGVLNEAGGSLALAVMNGKVTWPKTSVAHYPQELHSLVVYCLDTNMKTRPRLKDLVEQVKDIMKSGVLAS